MMRPLKKYAIAITIIFSNESWNQVISNHFLSGFLLYYKRKQVMSRFPLHSTSPISAEHEIQHEELAVKQKNNHTVVVSSRTAESKPAQRC